MVAAPREQAAAPRIPAAARPYAPRMNLSRAVAAADSKAPAGEDCPRTRARVGETPCWQCGKKRHWAEACPTLDARLRERLAGMFRWSPTPAVPSQSGYKRTGLRVAVTNPEDEASSSGCESTPLEERELPPGSEQGSEPSSESEEGNE